MKPHNLLIVEDNYALASALAAAASQTGARTGIAPSAALARKMLGESKPPYTGMVLDIGLPDMNGLSFLESLPESCRPPTLVITAHGELENTIQAKKLGVLEFFPKPLDFTAFKAALENLPGPTNERDKPQEVVPAFIGAAPSMRPVFQQIAQACASDIPVLVSGETGTGKSIVAQLVQRNSAREGQPRRIFHPSRSDQPSDIRAELDAAKGGSLLVEDIAALNGDSQAEFLRQWEKEPAGFPRILAVSNGNLREQVGAGEFRSDLYYRLQVLEIHLPPLRERMQDLLSLFTYFLARLQPGHAWQPSDGASQLVMDYGWPGNLRELHNVASFAVAACHPGTVVQPSHLPPYLVSPQQGRIVKTTDILDEALDQWLNIGGGLPPYRELAGELERRLLERLLPRFDGKLARLANELGANRSTLRKKLRVGRAP